jgi:uncharacterized protein YcnI
MGLFKALGRLTAQGVNNGYTNSRVNGASAKAYKQTGHEIQAAKKEGRWVNGSIAHKRNKSTNIRTAKQNGRTRSKFIDDIFD